MTELGRRKSLAPGDYILKFRAPIGLVLVAITMFMEYWAAHVQIGTRFENFFSEQPSEHVALPPVP
jgi:hypothetical protein